MTEIDDVEFGDSQEIESETPGPRLTGIRVSLPSLDCYGQLWLSVLLRAVEDATVVLKEPKMHLHNKGCPRKRGQIICDRRLPSDDHIAQKQAREWFVSARNDVGSFHWICSNLDLDTEVMRRELRKRAEANLEDQRLGRVGAARSYPRAVLHHRTGERGKVSAREPHNDNGRTDGA